MLNEPILILEDDAQLTDKFSFDDLDECIEKGYNFVYLGWREMEKSIPIDEKFVKPVYPYWTLAYMITPESAEILTNDIIRSAIIPVDEYLPIKMPHLKVCAYTQNVIVPLGREKSGSDVSFTRGSLCRHTMKTFVINLELSLIHISEPTRPY